MRRHGTETGRLAGLDALRAAAIGLVVVHHFRHLAGAPEWLRWFALRGHVGVDLFFVLSGWLIGGQLLRELRRTGSVDLPRFWARRWLRTLPAYLAVLALLVAAGPLTVADVPALALFLQNYVAPDRWLVTWSLCIEEHFYLGLPLVALALRWVGGRAGRAPVLALAAALVLLSPALRLAAFGPMSRGTYSSFIENFYSPTHLRLDGLGIGVAMAALHGSGAPLWRFLAARPRAMALVGAVLVAGSVWNPLLTGATSDPLERMTLFPAVFEFLLVAVGVALMLPLLATRRTRAWWAGPAAAVSDHAYALYLVHETARDVVVHWLPPAPFWVAFAACVAVSALFAAALRRAVELPGLALRQRFWPAEGGAPAAASARSALE